MSDANKAVFLSYAREDTDAARRIAEALRSQGIEVWFDQRELRGGEAWDAKIKKQIRECALFLAVVSAHTQERTEGYFRREWKLAVERTQDMAAGVTFMVPVVIDDTVEAQAVVPDEFMRVQWTRLPGALPTPDFVAQVKNLLGGGRRKPTIAPMAATQTAAPMRTKPPMTPLPVVAPKPPAPVVAAPSEKKSGRSIWIWVVLLLVIGGAAAGFVLLREPEPPPAPPKPVVARKPAPVAPAPPPEPVITDKSIAVLPFENMSEEKDSAFFADGIHEDILTNLSNIRQLRVVSRTSVMQYRATTKAMPQIARELGVAYILEGSVRRAGNKVRVTGQLIKADTDEHVWAKAYDRNLTDIFVIQAELSQEIAAALQAALSPQEKTLLERRPTDNLAAYELVLKARELGNLPQWNLEKTQEAERLLQSAVQLDPNYAVAYADLVYITSFGHYFSDPLVTKDPRSGWLTKAKDAMEQAVRLAPDSPDTIRALGDYYYYGFRDYIRATGQYEKLTHLRPNDSTAYLRLAAIQRRQTRWSESLTSFRRADELDPGNLRNVRDLGILFTAGHRYEEAITQQRRIAERRPDDIQAGFELAELAFLQSGSTREMELFFARLPAARSDSAPGRAFRKRWALYHGDLAEAIRLDRLLGPNDESDGTFGNFVNRTIDVAVAFAAQGDMKATRVRLGDFPAALRARIKSVPDDYRLWAGLARMEALLGHREEALRCARQALELGPASMDAIAGAAMRANLAFVLAWTGDKDKAIAEYTQLLHMPFGGLEGAGGYNTTNVNVMKSAPDYALLRSDPRFKALLNDPKNNAPLF